MSAPRRQAPIEWDRVVAAKYLRHRVQKVVGKNPKHGAMTELARVVKVNRQALSHIVTGIRQGTSVETFDKFARHFGETHDAFLRLACDWAAEHPDVIEQARDARERDANPLARFTDADLLEELARRAARRAKGGS